MPNVPVYNTPQAAPADLPGVRQQAPYRMMQMAEIAPGEQHRLGTALMQAGEAGMNILTQEQILNNETKAKTFDALHVTTNDAILHGSDDGSTKGYLALKGQAAVDAYDATVKQLQKVPVDLSSSLDNQAQQRLVANTMQLRMNAALTQAKVHRDQQLQIASQAADDARIKTNTDSAAKSFNPITDNAPAAFDHDNPGQNSAYQQALQTIVSSVRSRYGDMGEDVVKEKTQEALGRAYVATIGHMLDGKRTDPSVMAVAKDYFNKVQDQIPVEVADKIKGILDSKSVLADSQAKSDDIMARFGNDPTAALAEVKKITDPEVREKTHALVREQINENDAIKSKQRQDADNNGLTIFTNGGSLRDVQNSKFWNQMSAHAQRQVEEWAKSNALHAAQMSQLDKMNDLVGLQKIIQLRSENPTAFANLDIVKTAQSPDINIKSPATIKQLIEMQGNFNKGDAQEAAFNTAYRNARVLYQPLLQQAGISPMPNMDKEQKTAAEGNVARFEGQVQADIQQYMKDSGGKMPDGKALQTIIQQNLTPMFVHGTGSWFGLGADQSKPLFQLSPEERAKAYSVSSSDLQKQAPAQYAKVYNDLKTKLGRAPTNTEIENQYTQMVLMMKGK